MTEVGNNYIQLKEELKRQEAADKQWVRRDQSRTLLVGFRHLGYSATPFKKGWKVKCTYESAFHDIPSSFQWTNQDMEGCKAYITALVGERVTAAKYAENEGLAIELVYPQVEVNKTPIRMNIDEFVDILLLRGHIDLPAHRRIMFYTDRAKKIFLPVEFITAISHLPRLEYMQEHLGDWSPASALDYKDAGLDAPEKINLGMGKEHPELSIASLAPGGAVPTPGAEQPVTASAAAPMPVSPASAAPQEPESEITRKAHNKHFELITCIKPRSGQIYFVRRLATYGGVLLWAGTSFSLEGPWTEYLRENALLIGLGVDP